MRRVERIPRIMRFFRKNPIAFSQFIGISTDEPEFITYKNNFSDRYEELFATWYSNTDLRFGQLLITQKIIPDLGCWNYEEDVWLVNNKWMKLESIMMWGHLGLDYNSKMDLWESEKPKFNEKMESWEANYYIGLKPIDIYAIKYNNWRKRRPEYSFSFLEDLSKDHIKNILLNCKVSNEYKEAFERVLKNGH